MNLTTVTIIIVIISLLLAQSCNGRASKASPSSKSSKRSTSSSDQKASPSSHSSPSSPASGHPTIPVFIALPEAPPTNYLPSLGYLGQGYDILRGNPHTTHVSDGADPGYRLNVFDLTHYKGKSTPDFKWSLPEGTQAESCYDCSIDSTMVNITGTHSYEDSLSVDVSVDGDITGEGWNTKFSASADYKDVEKGTENAASVYAVSVAECCAYQISRDDGTPPPLDENFIASINQLPINYTLEPAKYFSFIHTFGTHIINTMVMGGRFGASDRILSSSWARMASSGLDIKLAVSASFVIDTVGVNGATSEQQQLSDTYHSYTEETRIFKIGGEFPKDGQESTWTTTVRDSPMPLRITLSSITTVFDEKYFSNKKLPAKLTEKLASLTAALYDYCGYLELQGQCCVSAGPDPNLPISARFFGGLYQYDTCGVVNVNNYYTGALNCVTGTQPYPVGNVYLGITGNVICAGMQYVCLNPIMPSDPLMNFGGMYQVTRQGTVEDNVVNPLTGDITCPSGFNGYLRSFVISASGGLTNQYFCKNDNAQLTIEPVGGFYHKSDPSHPDIVNPYTNALSCPPNYCAEVYSEVEIVDVTVINSWESLYVCLYCQPE